MKLLKAAGKAALTVATFFLAITLLALWPVAIMLFAMFALLTGAFYVAAED